MIHHPHKSAPPGSDTCQPPVVATHPRPYSVERATSLARCTSMDSRSQQQAKGKGPKKRTAPAAAEASNSEHETPEAAEGCQPVSQSERQAQRANQAAAGGSSLSSGSSASSRSSSAQSSTPRSGLTVVSFASAIEAFFGTVLHPEDERRRKTALEHPGRKVQARTRRSCLPSRRLSCTGSNTNQTSCC
jgi:hypothetical protein